MSAHPIEPAPAMTPEQRFDCDVEIMCSMPTNDLATSREDILDSLVADQARFDAMTAHRRALLKAADEEFLGRIAATGGSALPDVDYEIVREQKTEKTKNLAILQQLKSELPDEEYAKAIFTKVVEPTLDADGQKLNALAKKYGEKSRVGEIIAQGYAPKAVGKPTLVITRRQKRVAQIEGAA